jgi:hypothetical protein
MKFPETKGEGTVFMKAKLSRAQAAAMYVLVQARAARSLAQPSRCSTDENRSWLRVQARVVKALEKLGFAKHKCVLIDGREVTGVDLAHMLGYWSVKYEITPAGLQCWRKLTEDERYGLPRDPSGESLVPRAF